VGYLNRATRKVLSFPATRRSDGPWGEDLTIHRVLEIMDALADAQELLKHANDAILLQRPLWEIEEILAQVVATVESVETITARQF
jgi:hypothetical protein